MAAWRTKAYSLFGFKQGSYGGAIAKTELLADLVFMARRAVEQDDDAMLGRIVEYICWASRQKADEFISAVELAFFLPVFRDSELCTAIKSRIPADLFSDKWRILMEDTTGGGVD